jgi:hypothetical protein
MSVSKKQKLELTWIGKENRPRLEPRILLEDPEKSYHAAHRVSEHDRFDNRLIFGDNLLALKALESQRNDKCRSLFEAQDKVDQQRDDLIANIEGKLTQRSSLNRLFAIHWNLN